MGGGGGMRRGWGITVVNSTKLQSSSITPLQPPKEPLTVSRILPTAMCDNHVLVAGTVTDTGNSLARYDCKSSQPFCNTPQVHNCSAILRPSDGRPNTLASATYRILPGSLPQDKTCSTFLKTGIASKLLISIMLCRQAFALSPVLHLSFQTTW